MVVDASFIFEPKSMRLPTSIGLECVTLRAIVVIFEDVFFLKRFDVAAFAELVR